MSCLPVFLTLYYFIQKGKSTPTFTLLESSVHLHTVQAVGKMFCPCDCFISLHFIKHCFYNSVYNDHIIPSRLSHVDAWTSRSVFFDSWVVVHCEELPRFIILSPVEGLGVVFRCVTRGRTAIEVFANRFLREPQIFLSILYFMDKVLYCVCCSISPNLPFIFPPNN